MAAGSGVAEGDQRAVRAAQAAISRLPAGASIGRARGIMVDVAGGGDLVNREGTVRGQPCTHRSPQVRGHLPVSFQSKRPWHYFIMHDTTVDPF